MNNRYVIIILAAGGSSRLGTPKQLLKYHHTSLLSNVVDAAMEVSSASPVVVIGAYKEQVQEELRGKDVTVLFNPEWPTGMASSIRCAVNNAKTNKPAPDACIITVCDQPFVSAEVLNELIKEHEESGKGIVASTYAGATGTPALFSSRYFDELMALEGDEGAKKLIKTHFDDVALVPFSRGVFDIDTQEDYAKLN